MANEATHVEWSEVWRLYLDYLDVFQGVFLYFRQMGQNLPGVEETDLLHEFLVDHAPRALATFRPEKGALRSWLFVVFKRFVIGKHRQRQRYREVLRRIEGSFEHNSEADLSRRVDVAQVRASMEQLSAAEQEAISVYFGEEGSVRAVSRALGIPRWRADKVVLAATTRVVLAMGADVGLPKQALREFLSPSNDQTCSQPDAEAVNHRVHGNLKALLDFLSSERGEDMLKPNEVRGPSGRTADREAHMAGCQNVAVFLDGNSHTLNPDTALELLQHVATCEHCASRLHDQELHVEALLAATRSVEEPDRANAHEVEEAADVFVADDQRELLVFARAVLEELNDEARKALENCLNLSSEHRSDLWMLEKGKKEVPDALFRLSLSVAEATLSLSTILSSRCLGAGRAWIREEGVVFQWFVGSESESKEVGSSYFASQLEDRADLPPGLADWVWSAFVRVALRGQVGLPGLYLDTGLDQQHAFVLAD